MREAGFAATSATPPCAGVMHMRLDSSESEECRMTTDPAPPLFETPLLEALLLEIAETSEYPVPPLSVLPE